MKNLFFVSFAFDANKKTGANIKRDVLHTYCKNICVSLLSAKASNPNMDVALVCNVEIPREYEELLIQNDILIYIEEFDSFVFPNDYPWGLAYYKLCALEKMVTKYEYDHYIYTDADVFIQNPLDDIILELKDHILLYDTNRGFQVQNYRTTIEQFKSFGIDSYITQYGGEFFGADRKNAEDFLACCKEIYNEMINREFRTTKGDEFITSIAAHRMKTKIKNAGAYIFRFWTGDFYLVSTSYKYNEIAILHMPDEKQRGLLKLYDFFMKKHKFPDKEKVHKMCRLTRSPIKDQLSSKIRKLLKK